MMSSLKKQGSGRSSPRDNSRWVGRPESHGQTAQGTYEARAWGGSTWPLTEREGARGREEGGERGGEVDAKVSGR